MEQPDRAAADGARAALAPLQQSVQALMDADRVLPADGSSLPAMLDRALEGLTRENASAAWAGIEAFIAQVQALIQAGVLEAADGRQPLEMARAIKEGFDGRR
jgi:hypothetical protein